jgi:hypothetical protein
VSVKSGSSEGDLHSELTESIEADEEDTGIEGAVGALEESKNRRSTLA